MAGTIRYKTNCYHTGLSDQDFAQAAFKNLWDFFKHLETNSVATEIARNNGDAATYANPLGTDFYDGANPFGEGAWAVFSMDSWASRGWVYYVFFAWSAGSSSFDNAPNAPARIRGSLGSNRNLGIAVAYGHQATFSDASPWPAAATGSMGSDTKQTPVWDIPSGGGAYLLPRSSTPDNGDSYSTNRENCGSVFNDSSVTSSQRLHFVADADNIAILFNRNDTTRIDNVVYIGKYLPLSGVTANVPLFMYNAVGTPALDIADFWGATTGGDTREGGVLHTLSTGTSEVWSAQQSWNDDGLDDNSPSAVFTAGTRYGLAPWEVHRYNEGQLGWADPDFYRCVKNLAHRDNRTGGDWVVVAQTSTAAAAKHVIPWDGSTMGAGFTRDGATS